MKKRRLALAITLFTALTVVIGLGHEFHRFTQQPLAIPEEGLVYELRPGASVTRLANDLAAEGYLQHPLYLRVLARFQGTAKSLKAGEYRLPRGITPPALLSLFASGKGIEHSLTLVEGWNYRQVLAAVKAHDSLKQTLAGLDPEGIMEQLGAFR